MSGRVANLPKPRALDRLISAVRDLLGLPESPADRRRRLDRKARVERAAKERL